MKLHHRVVDISNRLRSAPVPIILIQGLHQAGQGQLQDQIQAQFPSAFLHKIDAFPNLGSEESCNQCALTKFILEEISLGCERLRLIKNKEKLICIHIPTELDVTRITDALKGDDATFVQAVVTCISLERFIWDYSKDRSFEERFKELGCDPEEMSKTALKEPVLESLIDQIECTDFIYVSDSYASARSLDLIARLQPRARVLSEASSVQELCFSSIPIFKEDQTYRSAAWQELTFAKSDVTPQCFRAKRPFHPMRLNSLIDRWPESIVRSYGTIWLASHNDVSLTVSQVGPDGFFFSPEGYWLGTLPPLEQQIALQKHPEMKLGWDRNYADRMTEIAFVSDEPLTNDWTKSLEECLLTDIEMRMDWKRFPNPFPRFDDDGELDDDISGTESITKQLESKEKTSRSHLSLISPLETRDGTH